MIEIAPHTPGYDNLITRQLFLVLLFLISILGVEDQKHEFGLSNSKFGALNLISRSSAMSLEISSIFT